jgi:hypothetical protein
MTRTHTQHTQNMRTHVFATDKGAIDAPAECIVMHCVTRRPYHMYPQIFQSTNHPQHNDQPTYSPTHIMRTHNVCITDINLSYSCCYLWWASAFSGMHVCIHACIYACAYALTCATNPVLMLLSHVHACVCIPKRQSVLQQLLSECRMRTLLGGQICVYVYVCICMCICARVYACLCTVHL